MIMSSSWCKRNYMNPLNIHRDIHNSSLISFYLDIIPVSLISLPYPYSFLTLSILLYDSVYIFYCYTFVVHCCNSLVSAVKCGYSYIIHQEWFKYEVCVFEVLVHNILVGVMSGLSGIVFYFGGLGETGVLGAVCWVEAGTGGGWAGLTRLMALTHTLAGLPEHPVPCTGLPCNSQNCQ